MKTKISVNDVFGNVKVLERYGFKDQDLYWKCECLHCKNEVLINSTLLKKRLITNSGCNKCSRTGKTGYEWTGYEDISGYFYSRNKAAAQKRNLQFLVSKEDIWNCYLKQNKKCSLTGDNISFILNEISIDRQDPKQHYTKENIQLICKKLNQPKWILDNHQLFELTKYVNTDIYDSNEYINTILKNKNYKGYKDISGSCWSTLQRNARSRNLTFDLTIESLWELFISQNYRCKYTQKVLRFHNNKLTTVSLDRIDSSKGYIEGNIQWVHKIINRNKYTLSHLEYLVICKKIYQNLYQEYENKDIIKHWYEL